MKQGNMPTLKKISIQGYLGSFHHLVAKQEFGEDIELLERSTFAEVFEDVLAGGADYGVAAIENSIAGKVAETEAALKTYAVQVIKEVAIPIEHHLIGHPLSQLSEITTIYSHPMAIKQCLPYLLAHPDWRIVKTDDTAGSVKKIMQSGEITAAAISSEFSAELYSAKILERTIQADKQNMTRFLILEK